MEYILNHDYLEKQLKYYNNFLERLKFLNKTHKIPNIYDNN